MPDPGPAPSVAAAVLRDENKWLRAKLEKVAAHFDRLAEAIEHNAKDQRWPGLADASARDAKRWRETAKDIRSAMGAGAQPTGEREAAP